jgi:hypothetical protein
MNKTTNAVCELSVCTVLRDELQDEMSHRVCVECDIDSEQVVAGRHAPTTEPKQTSGNKGVLYITPPTTEYLHYFTP